MDTRLTCFSEAISVCIRENISQTSANVQNNNFLWYSENLLSGEIGRRKCQTKRWRPSAIKRLESIPADDILVFYITVFSTVAEVSNEKATAHSQLQSPPKGSEGLFWTIRRSARNNASH